MDLESQSDLMMMMMMMMMMGVVKLVISPLFLSWAERLADSLTPPFPHASLEVGSGMADPENSPLVSNRA